MISQYFQKRLEESLKDNNEGFNEQKISSGWTQDGWYYYVNGEPVRGIVEIQGCCYYFDEYTGRLCKKAQWIEKDGKRYYSNRGNLYQNQMISFGSTYYYIWELMEVSKAELLMQAMRRCTMLEKTG